MLLALEGMSRPVEFTGCDDLASGVAAILRGWGLGEVSPTDAPAPIIRLRKTTRGYRRVSPWLLSPSLCRAKIRRGKVAAICGFHYELIIWYAQEHSSRLCLHCAAAQFDEGLVMFPSTHKAGKSTLSVHLAAAGARLYSDDVLPIDPSNIHGISMGILPRLRMPLPNDAGAAFRDFVRERKGPRQRRSMYVDLREDEMAPLGTTAPVRGIVLLERAPDGAPALIPAPKDDILKQVISQNFGREMPAMNILNSLHAIVAGAACFTLRYATGEQATELLLNAFPSKQTCSAA